MSAAPTVATIRESGDARLVRVTCTAGRHDRPFPEAHGEDAWTIALVRHGRFRYRSSFVTGEILRTGWLLVGAPSVAYECSHDRDGGDHCASLSISRELLAEVALDTSIEATLRRHAALPPDARIAALVERATSRDDLDLAEAAYAIASAVTAHASGRSPEAVAPSTMHVRRVHDAIERIETACREPLSLADLARTANLSAFHFLRVFRRVTGTTPHQYLLGARIRLAARLLLDTRRPITEIAYDVGFADLSNFVRTFHRVVGMAPSRFRV